MLSARRRPQPQAARASRGVALAAGFAHVGRRRLNVHDRLVRRLRQCVTGSENFVQAQPEPRAVEERLPALLSQ